MAMRRTEEAETRYWKHVVEFGKPPLYQVEKWTVTDMHKPKVFSGATKEEIVGATYDEAEGCYVGDDDYGDLIDDDVAPRGDYDAIDGGAPPEQTAGDPADVGDDDDDDGPPPAEDIDFDDDLDEPIVEEVEKEPAAE